MNFRARPYGRHDQHFLYDLTLWAAFSIAIIVLLTVAGCANTGAAIKAGYGVADSYAQRATNLLQADLITVDEAKKRSALLKQAKQALDTAKNAWAECVAAAGPISVGPPTCDQARVSLDAANVLLAQVEAWLISEEKKK